MTFNMKASTVIISRTYILSHTQALQCLWGGAQMNTGYGEFREKAKKSVGYEAQPVECFTGLRVVCTTGG
jgi:hypothetical protein